jgi:uncharacterized protein
MKGLASIGGWLWHSGKPVVSSAGEERATEPHDADSQFNMGKRIAGEIGAAQNYVQAAKWYLKAAAQDHTEAQFNLGLMYGKGQGVRRDEATAIMWLWKAAKLGHPGAQYHVGVRQYRVSKSSRLPEASKCRIEALTWLLLAVAQSYRGAESAREFVALGMTQDEVNEAERSAAAFQADQTRSATAQI